MFVTRVSTCRHIGMLVTSRRVFLLSPFCTMKNAEERSEWSVVAGCLLPVNWWHFFILSIIHEPIQQCHCRGSYSIQLSFHQVFLRGLKNTDWFLSRADLVKFHRQSALSIARTRSARFDLALRVYYIIRFWLSVPLAESNVYHISRRWQCSPMNTPMQLVRGKATAWRVQLKLAYIETSVHIWMCLLVNSDTCKCVCL